MVTDIEIAGLILGRFPLLISALNIIARALKLSRTGGSSSAPIKKCKQDIKFYQVLFEGNLEPHAKAEARLMLEEKVPSEDFFTSADALLAKAYEQRARKIAYEENDEETA